MKSIKIFVLLCSAFAISFLASCNDSGAQPKSDIYVINAAVEPHSIFYSGKIEPVLASTVVSGYKGTLQDIYVKYGDHVKVGQLLFTLAGEGGESSYFEIIIDYLKARDNLQFSEYKLKNEKELWNAGVIAKNEYEEDLKKYDLDYISYLTSLSKLKKLAKILEFDAKEIDKINIRDKEAINKLISTQQSIPIRAEKEGVFLKSFDKDIINLIPGIDVKKSQLFGYIGKSSQYFVKIKVSEIDINKIKVGQHAVISGEGFPGHSLAGTVSQVGVFNFDRDGSMNNISYPVDVVIEDIDTKITRDIKAGMSAKVELIEEIKGKVFVPVSAIKFDGENYIVQKIVGDNVITHIVKPGKTTIDKVEILEGLSFGDKLII